MKKVSGKQAVLTSSLVSIGDVVFSFGVAAITGSAVMFAQGLQGLADSITTLFLYIGLKKSSKGATEQHPFGHGRELFFWVLLSSIFAFLFSGGYASIKALQQITDSEPLVSIWIALIALSFGLFTNGFSLYTSLKRLRQNSKKQSLWRYLRTSSLVETKMTLLVDFLGSLAAGFGLLSLVLFLLTDNPIFDGIGALIIGLLTAAGALIVILDLRDLIVGRSPSQQVIKNIQASALSVEHVIDVLDLRAVSIGSGQILVILELHFQDGLTTDQLEQVTDSVKETVKKSVPEVSQVQVEAETPD